MFVIHSAMVLISVERLNLVERENEYLKEKLKRIEGEKMELELHVADVVDDHKIKMEKMRLKIRKIRKYADRKSTRLNSSHPLSSRMPSSA